MFFYFLAFAPFLFVVWHDAYHFIVVDEAKELSLSAMGYIWTEFMPSSFIYVSENLSQDLWDALENSLDAPALYFSVGFAVFVFGLQRILRRFF